MAEATASSISDAFARAHDEGRAALMPYMMAGYPSVEGSKAIARAYADAGADLIELGIPFSDPLADGPVIHAAATAALEAGTTMDSALEVCGEVADRVPVVAMTYANMILAGGGPEEFARKLVEAGAAGAIVPDLPLEEAAPVRDSLLAAGLAFVPLIAPTTPPERRRAISGQVGESGFVYVVSTVGVTGERSELPPELTDLVADVREGAAAPVAVGFGIGTPEQAATVGEIADGVIIGSRLVRMAGDEPLEGAIDEIGTFLRDVRSALGSGD
ncbi:MAG TPA: tryptophan synthase subunit alpha [Solirubrobacterales bacterium]|nr:tryptophan synthase subunit alpha [Solirubrobacterales bacterium]